MVSPLTSTIIATSYIAIVAILASILFARSRTPLRLSSVVMAVLGLSISIVSIVYATGTVSSTVFWLHQFIAECVAVTWVVTTIIHLGYAFYPTTRHQIALWRAALASVVLYDLVAIGELAYYCTIVWGEDGSNEGNLPVVWVYWVRQVIKVLACSIAIAYLFVPLVQHHNNANVSMVADSNSLAVGIWYLSALGATFVAYSCMFIYYMTKPDKVFSIQAQSLDLCLRLIACPIFSLPPPNALLDYFEAKYGSAVNDNANTMVEEGITNDPRPRRPPMLVNQQTGSSMRRNSDFMLDLPPFNPSSSPPSSYESHQDPLHQLSPPQESDEDRIQTMVGLGGKPIRMF